MRTCYTLPLLAWLISRPVVGLAGSWEITQSVSVANGLSMIQEGGSGSIQAANHINFGNEAGIANSQQNITGTNISLTQTGGSNNRQALNRIVANSVINSNQSITTNNLTLSQTAGAGNIQAGNMLETGSTTNNNVQSVTTGSATFSYDTPTISLSANRQTGNIAIVSNGSLQQTFTAGTVTINGEVQSGSAFNNYTTANSVIYLSN